MIQRPTAKTSKHPIFARIYDPLLARPAERWEGRYRSEQCGGAEGLVLEIGAGTGMNFPHYSDVSTVVAVEPEPHMLEQAKQRAAGDPAPIVLLRASAECLPFPDGTFDTVVSSLVLCTVPDERQAIREVRRVLKPQSPLRFYEHVRAKSDRAARWQDRLERPWGFFGGGCHPNRDTVGALVEEGFTVRFRSFEPPVPGGWFLPHVIGEARVKGERPEATSSR
ncbi:MAG TPA: class I SAM-dependent methyltransferase [Actinomycetota bacterium]|nr:class I SAM-dependent methyltransferase [Actinomycetota bacterium]